MYMYVMTCYCRLNAQKGQAQFELSLKSVFEAVTNLLMHPENHFLLAQSACLKHLPKIFDDVITVCPPQQIR